MSLEKRVIAISGHWELAKFNEEGEPLELGNYVMIYDQIMTKDDALMLAKALHKELMNAQSHVQSKHNAMAYVISQRDKGHQRWSPCVVDAEDEDGPVFQGFLTDPNGEWVKWEDIVAGRVVKG